METQGQGGRDGGRRPPPTALGYFGESDDEPKRYRNAKARREKRKVLPEPAVVTVERTLRGALAELRRVVWPSRLEIVGELLRTLATVTVVSLPLCSLGLLFSDLLG